MTPVDKIRDFLDRYHSDEVFENISPPKESESPPDRIRDKQDVTTGIQDEHVIPIDSFEFRTDGDDRYEDNPRYVKYEDVIGVVEASWDDAVEEYGLNSVSNYLPFHEDEEEYGIYIQQRGIRTLGHLLYQWSRVGNLTETKEEATEFLLNKDFQNGDYLYEGEPQFDSLEDALDLAQEIILRNQWFHHQIEILASYAEDIDDTPIYPKYHQNNLALSEIGDSTEEVIANQYVFKSRACSNRAPDGLYEPLILRATGAHRLRHQRAYDRNFSEGCHRISQELIQRNSGISLSKELVFDTDVRSAIPSRISAYITRRESDPDTGTYANDEHPIDQSYDIQYTDKWEKKYEKADSTIKDNVDSSVIDKIRESPASVISNRKGEGEGETNLYYCDVEGGIRFVFKLKRAERTFELVDFGDHDGVPRRHNLHKQ
jgi:hypothetical protein